MKAIIPALQFQKQKAPQQKRAVQIQAVNLQDYVASVDDTVQVFNFDKAKAKMPRHGGH